MLDALPRSGGPRHPRDVERLDVCEGVTKKRAFVGADAVTFAALFTTAAVACLQLAITGHWSIMDDSPDRDINTKHVNVNRHSHG